MRPLFTAVLIIVAVSLPAPAIGAEMVAVADLIEFAEELSGEEVVVEGELVGDYGYRSDGWMWSQLNGDSYVDQPLREGGAVVAANVGIGVRMPTSLALDLDPPGGYRNRGPVVRLTGTWKYHDPDRQGESYLEVASLTIVEAGRPLTEDGDWPTIAIGIVLIGSAVIGWLTRRRTSPA